jgi:outer membrane protein TolC
LCVLQGIPPTDLLPELGDAPIPMAKSEVAIGIPADLLRRRPDVRAAGRQAAAESARIGIAAADLFPSFTIAGSMGVASEDLGDLFDSSSFTGSVGPGFNWNVLNYGRLVARVDKQTAKFREAVLNYQETALQANAEVEQALIAYLNLQKEETQLREAVEATRKAVQTANREYRGGIASFNRVFVMEGLLVLQENRLAQVQGDVAVSLVRVYKAIGGGWQFNWKNYQPMIEVEDGPVEMIDEPEQIELSPATLPESVRTLTDADIQALATALRHGFDPTIVPVLIEDLPPTPATARRPAPLGESQGLPNPFK